MSLPQYASAGLRILLLPLVLTGCGGSYSGMSPSQVTKAFLRAERAGNREVIRQLVFIEPGMTEAEIDRHISAMFGDSDPNAKAIRTGLAILISSQVWGERIDGETAYVYVKMGPVFLHKRPFTVAVLRRQAGCWRIRGNRVSFENTSIWRRLAAKEPPDPDALYYLGEKLRNGERVMLINPDPKYPGPTWVLLPFDQRKVAEYLRRYLELEPKGFWVENVQGYLASLEQAFESYRRTEEALRANPNNAEEIWAQAQRARAFGKCRSAIALYERYLQVAPNGKWANSAGNSIRGSMRDMARQKEYFASHPERLAEIEAELGYKLFEDDPKPAAPAVAPGPEVKP